MDPTRYDEAYYAQNGQSGDRPALRLYTRFAGRYLRPTRALDVGCGTGHLLARLNRLCPTDGLELSAYSASVARTTSPSSTVFESPDDLPAAHYDALTAIHVFEHIADTDLSALLTQLRGACVPGARALVVIPDPAGRASRMRAERWLGLTDPTHINLKPHAEWREFFTANGLHVLHEGSDGLWNFPYSRLPVPFDAARYGLPMAAQFLAGRMFLPPGAGESSFFVLSWDA